MNWGKIIGVVMAILFILLSIQQINTDLKSGESQLKSLSGLINDNVEFKILSFNESDLIINVKNPLNVSLTICNITGEYVYLQSKVTVPPLSSSNITLVITNFSNFINNVKNGNETVTIKVKLLSTKITTVKKL